MVLWDEPLIDSGPYEGYQVFMTDMLTGTKSLIYDGSRNPNTLSFVATGLDPGSQYGFQARAFNFNGAGAESTIATFKSCTLPSGLAAPTIYSTTATTIVFQWTPPSDDGACPILGYKLHIDDGSHGDFTSVDEDLIGNRDYLRSHTVTFDSTDSGKSFRFYIEAFNEIGSALSSKGSQLLAGVPGKPDVDLVSDPDVTDTDTIKVTWGELADNGGDEIISYSLEIDDGMGGDFTAVVGYATDYLLLFYTHAGVTRGTNYRLRYRARNRIGWSEYSNIVYVLAATKPQKPPAPTLQSTDATSITLNLL